MNNLSFTKQELAIHAPRVRSILKEEKDSNKAKDLFLHEIGVKKNNGVAKPDDFKRFDKLFEYVKRY